MHCFHLSMEPDQESVFRNAKTKAKGEIRQVKVR